MASSGKSCASCGGQYGSEVLFCPLDGTPLSSSRTLTAIPNEIDPYLFLELPGQVQLNALVGIGSMGRVYRAFQAGIDRDVAVKILHRELTGNQELVGRFHREAKIASKLVHPNVVQVLMTGTLPHAADARTGGEVYLVMEYLDGISLLSALHAQGEGGALPLARTLHIVLQLCEAVGEAHVCNIVHRDLKPENIMLIRRGEDPDFVKVLDFGIARLDSAIEGSTTQAGLIFGTAKYISPEGAEGKHVGPQADVYAIATILYQCLAGRTPFQGDSPMALLVQQIHGTPADLRTIPRAAYVPEPIARMVMGNLSKEPAERSENARAFARELSLAARDAGLHLDTMHGGVPRGDLRLLSKQRTRQHEFSAELKAKIASMPAVHGAPGNGAPAGARPGGDVHGAVTRNGATNGIGSASAGAIARPITSYEELHDAPRPPSPPAPAPPSSSPHAAPSPASQPRGSGYSTDERPAPFQRVSYTEIGAHPGRPGLTQVPTEGLDTSDMGFAEVSLNELGLSQPGFTQIVDEDATINGTLTTDGASVRRNGPISVQRLREAHAAEMRAAEARAAEEQGLERPGYTIPGQPIDGSAVEGPLSDRAPERMPTPPGRASNPGPGPISAPPISSGRGLRAGSNPSIPQAPHSQPGVPAPGPSQPGIPGQSQPGLSQPGFPKAGPSQPPGIMPSRNSQPAIAVAAMTSGKGPPALPVSAGVAAVRPRPKKADATLVEPVVRNPVASEAISDEPPPRPVTWRTFALIASLLIVVPVGALGAARLFGMQAQDDKSFDATLTAAQVAMEKRAWNVPAGQNVKELTDRLLAEQPGDRRVLGLRATAAGLMVTDAYTLKHSGDSAAALQLARLALELSPDLEAASLLVGELERTTSTVPAPAVLPTPGVEATAPVVTAAKPSTGRPVIKPTGTPGALVTPPGSAKVKPPATTQPDDPPPDRTPPPPSGPWL